MAWSAPETIWHGLLLRPWLGLLPRPWHGLLLRPWRTGASGFSDSAAHGVQIDEQQNDEEPMFVNIALQIPASSPLNEVPCGQCPVMHECCDGGVVTPATCQYMQAWLDF